MTGRFNVQHWISAFLLLFLSFSLLVPWSAFYRGFLFVGVLPLVIYACVRPKKQPGTGDKLVWFSAGFIGYMTAANFVPDGLLLEEQYQTLRWAFSTVVFLLAVVVATQRWLSKPLFYARIITGVSLISGTLAIASYFWTGEYPARISGLGFLSHPILGAASLISFWAIGMVVYRVDERYTVYDYIIKFVSFIVVFVFVMLSQSRGPLVALLIFVGAFTLALLVVNKRSRAWGYAAVLLGICLLFGVLSTFLFDDLLARMVDRGMSYRPLIWLSVLQYPPELIWLGAGAASDFTQSSAGLYLYEQTGVRIEHPHNLLLGAFHYSGIVGALGLLAILLWVLVRLVRLPGDSSQRLRPFALSLYLLIPLLNMTDGYRLVAPPSPDWLFFWLPITFLMGLVKFLETRHR